MPGDIARGDSAFQLSLRYFVGFFHFRWRCRYYIPGSVQAQALQVGNEAIDNASQGSSGIRIQWPTPTGQLPTGLSTTLQQIAQGIRQKNDKWWKRSKRYQTAKHRPRPPLTQLYQGHKRPKPSPNQCTKDTTRSTNTYTESNEPIHPNAQAPTKTRVTYRYVAGNMQTTDTSSR